MVFRKKSKGNELYERNPGLVVIGQPKSTIAEQFQILKTNIRFSMNDQNLKSLVVTSAEPKSGKSVIAANLAASFSTEDTRVLLVDSDLRRPSVHQTFRLPNTDGLTTLLMQENTDLSDMVYKSHTEGLYLLTSGPIPENTANILASERMKKLKKEMEETFDLIIFDVPSVIEFADAQIMANKVDGTIFVIPQSGVKKEKVIKAKELLKMAEANVIGAVLNHVGKNPTDYYAEEY